MSSLDIYLDQAGMEGPQSKANRRETDPMDFNPASRRPHIFDTKAGALDYLFDQAGTARKRLRAG
jgi:hypothetical protein